MEKEVSMGKEQEQEKKKQVRLEITPEELEIMGEPEFYNYRCNSCGHKDQVNEAAVFMGISEEPTVLECPECGGRFVFDEDQSPPEGR